jgi:hypothetical protein
MTEQTQIVADGFEHRTLATCRSCGDAVWYLDLEDTSTGADDRISFSCGNCGTRIAISAPTIDEAQGQELRDLWTQSETLYAQSLELRAESLELGFRCLELRFASLAIRDRDDLKRAGEP